MLMVPADHPARRQRSRLRLPTRVDPPRALRRLARRAAEWGGRGRPLRGHAHWLPPCRHQPTDLRRSRADVAGLGVRRHGPPRPTTAVGRRDGSGMDDVFGSRGLRYAGPRQPGARRLNQRQGELVVASPGPQAAKLTVHLLMTTSHVQGRGCSVTTSTTGSDYTVDHRCPGSWSPSARRCAVWPHLPQGAMIRSSAES